MDRTYISDISSSLSEAKYILITACIRRISCAVMYNDMHHDLFLSVVKLR